MGEQACSHHGHLPQGHPGLGLETLTIDLLFVWWVDLQVESAKQVPIVSRIYRLRTEWHKSSLFPVKGKLWCLCVILAGGAKCFNYSQNPGHTHYVKNILIPYPSSKSI